MLPLTPSALAIFKNVVSEGCRVLPHDFDIDLRSDVRPRHIYRIDLSG